MNRRRISRIAAAVFETLERRELLASVQSEGTLSHGGVCSCRGCSPLDFGFLSQGLLQSSAPRFRASINFQPAGAATPANFVADTGGVFAARNGLSYGWNIDNSRSARDRNSSRSPDQLHDTLTHLQQGAPKTWEIAVPNGTYAVRVVAGDPSYTDSVYRITAEGVLVLEGEPNRDMRWFDCIGIVTVNDGRLTLSSAQLAVNNKVNFIEIASYEPVGPQQQAPAAATPVFATRINFQPSSAGKPSGYLVDGGSTYGDRGNGYTYGWKTSNTSYMRDRNSAHAPDQRYDTFGYMQKDSFSNVWEISVPSGTYNVRIVAGDPDTLTGTYRINAEGISVIDGKPTSNQRFFDATRTVTVSDGKLTVTNGSGAFRNQINFIEITSTSTTNPPPPTGQTPYNGVIPIPGVIEAENFDNGGQGVSFYDTDSTNRGGKYRNTAVDIVSISDGGSGYAVGYIKAGEWLEYTVNVSQTAFYNMDFRVSSATNGGKFHVEFNGVNKTGSITVSNTGGWTSWKTITRTGVSLSAGTYVMRVAFDSATTSGQDIANLNWIKLTKQSSSSTPLQGQKISWSIGSPQSPFSRVEPGVIQVGSKLYVMGGYTSGYNAVTQRVDILDINTNTWTRGKDLPGGQTHAGVATDGRYIYWISGQVGPLYSAGTNKSWKYDTQTNTWSSFPSLPSIRYGGVAAVLGSELHFFGGADSSRTVAKKSHWKISLTASNPQWVSAASLPVAADHLGHAKIGDKLYLIGGEHDHQINYIQHKDLFRYDYKTDTYERLADMPTASSHFEGNVVVLNGKIYVMAGQIDHEQLTNEVRSYDPATNRWYLHTPMPAARKGGASWTKDGKLYYTVGDEWKNGQPLTTYVGRFV